MSTDTITKDTIEQIKEDLVHLNNELADRKAALPAHSVMPHQLQAIEALEDDISLKEEVLKSFENSEEEN